jgi:hypothetical protein
MCHQPFFRIFYNALILLILVMGVATASQAVDPEKQQMVSSWKTRLNLSDEQVAQVKGLLGEMQAKLEPLSEQMKSASEPDMKAVFGQVKQVRQEFQTSLNQVLSDEQQKEAAQIQQEVDELILAKIAGKRAEKLQQQFQLSPEQTQQAVPIYVRQMKELQAFVAEAQSGGEESQPRGKRASRRQKRAKVKQAKGLQSIMDDTDKQMKEIMNSEQWTAYQAYREKQKEENKAKRKG